MKKNIRILENIRYNLYSWKSYDELSLEEIMKEFEKFPRKEYSSYYTSILTDRILIKDILEIGRTFYSNSNILINVISSLGNIVERYNFSPSDEIFEFLEKAISNKKANYYVSLFIFSFPQYYNWEYRWDYLVSIPNIIPKKKSIINFLIGIKKTIRDEEIIPKEIIIKIINIIKLHINSKLFNDYLKNDYSNTLSLLEEKLGNG
ncbi:hypothetical protein CGC50_13340 [Capnocytophaga gingivalis]|jgi:hypothetical protein|uniref:Uncharacterized protein n=1 Tax=Capnocytophaga gingivalis TaxID=1017 RepID=A0A250FSE6_9FLAO|nr:hypothetical protein [Capnocytophaga gingivalis]ATA88033.1 hypothetical protein CGC50_13340 [Capnocytophaga gingivalis]